MDLDEIGIGICLRKMRAIDTQKKPGEGGLNYRIPVNGVPTYDFHMRNRTAAHNVINAVTKLALDEKVPATVEEKQYWSTVKSHESWFGGAGTTTLCGFYGSIFGPIFCIQPPQPLHLVGACIAHQLGYWYWFAYPRKDYEFKGHSKILYESRQARFFMAGLAFTIYLNEGYFLSDLHEKYRPWHQWISYAVSRPTPLGDAARALYEAELIKDEGNPDMWRIPQRELLSIRLLTASWGGWFEEFGGAGNANPWSIRSLFS